MSAAGPIRATAVLATVLAAVAFSACGGDDEEPATTAAGAASDGTCAEVEAPAPKEASFAKPGQVLERGQPATATVRTSCGTFTIKLDTKNSPKTANSFAFLAEEGLYDGTTFHRVVPGFVIQGGDPQGNGQGGPGYSITEPPPQDVTYKTGLVAMAKTEIEPPGSSGSQFFVVTAPADAGLPPDYAVLGEVTAGMETVDAIAGLANPGDPLGQPSQTVTIDQVTIDAG